MTPDNGFVDLRLNRQEGQNQESFWPSFTDIMTVIVMIFLIAMVILLLRNIELVKQLRATMEAERHAMELARSTGVEKESLALQLIAAENDISMLRIKTKRLEEEGKKQVAAMGKQSENLSLLNAQVVDLTLRRDQLSAENYTLTEKLRISETTINTQKQSLNVAQENLKATQQQLIKTQLDLAVTQADLSTLKAATRQLEQQFSELGNRFKTQSIELLQTQAKGRRTDQDLQGLQDDYSELKVKYDKLIRPARSPVGRYVIEIRYTKVNDHFKVEYKTADKPAFQVVDQVLLEQTLDGLMTTKSNGLYIKLIFAENSGLSFNEAWGITSHLQGKYDYYHTTPPEMVPLVPVPGADQ